MCLFPQACASLLNEQIGLLRDVNWKGCRRVVNFYKHYVPAARFCPDPSVCRARYFQLLEPVSKLIAGDIEQLGCFGLIAVAACDCLAD